MILLLLLLDLGLAGVVQGNSVHVTTGGEICLDSCESRGYSYNWCKTEWKWDYCSLSEGEDIYGNRCNGPCTAELDRNGYFKCGDQQCGPIEKRCTQPEDPEKIATLELRSDFEAGGWGRSEYCPLGQHVVGFQLLSQPYQSYGLGAADDNGLVGIRLYCSASFKAATTDSSNMCQIASKVHYYTFLRKSKPTWTSPRFCKNGFVVGAVLKVEERQGTGDDTGATNLKLRCSDGKMLHVELDFEPGKWQNEEKDKKECPKGSALCGLRTRVETTHHDDNTGLNALDIYCCPLKAVSVADLAKDCDAELQWQEIGALNNAGSGILELSRRAKVGFSSSETKRNLETMSEANSVENSWGVEASVEYEFAKTAKATLSAKFDQKFASTKTMGSEKEKTLLSAFEHETETTIRAPVPPHTEVHLYQMKGTCGPFVVYPDKFLTNETRH